MSCSRLKWCCFSKNSLSSRHRGIKIICADTCWSWKLYKNVGRCMHSFIHRTAFTINVRPVCDDFWEVGTTAAGGTRRRAPKSEVLDVVQLVHIHTSPGTQWPPSTCNKQPRTCRLLCTQPQVYSFSQYCDIIIITTRAIRNVTHFGSFSFRLTESGE